MEQEGNGSVPTMVWIVKKPSTISVYFSCFVVVPQLSYSLINIIVVFYLWHIAYYFVFSVRSNWSLHPIQIYGPASCKSLIATRRLKGDGVNYEPYNIKSIMPIHTLVTRLHFPIKSFMSFSIPMRQFSARHKFIIYVCIFLMCITAILTIIFFNVFNCFPIIQNFKLHSHQSKTSTSNCLFNRQKLE